MSVSTPLTARVVTAAMYRMQCSLQQLYCMSRTKPTLQGLTKGQQAQALQMHAYEARALIDMHEQHLSACGLALARFPAAND